MGNDMADAIRDELRDELIRAYGTLEAAAVAVGIPYKTLYRALTTRGKDRSQSVKLDLVIDISEHLATIGRATFTDIYNRAAVAREAVRRELDAPSNLFADVVSEMDAKTSAIDNAAASSPSGAEMYARFLIHSEPGTEAVLAEKLRDEIRAVYPSLDDFEKASRAAGYDIDLADLEQQLAAHASDELASGDDDPAAVITAFLDETRSERHGSSTA